MQEQGRDCKPLYWGSALADSGNNIILLSRINYYVSTLSRNEFGQIAAAVNQMNGQINALIQENYERQLHIKTSEMNLLQEQINPHFLYNALGTITFIALREGGKQTVRSVRCLADFYRMSLNRGRQAVTAGEEVKLLQSYMNIQTLRFPAFRVRGRKFMWSFWEGSDG